MSQQLSLPGLARNDPVALFFVGLMPAPAAANAAVRVASDLTRAYGIRAKIFPPKRLHVTMHRLGHYDAVPVGLIRQMDAVAQAITVPPFEITLDRGKSFPRSAREHAFVLHESSASAALAECHETLGAALVKHGLGKHVSRGFTPHMTLFYHRRILAEQPVPPICWMVRDFVLVQSLQGFGRYNFLGRWPLRP